MFQATLTRLMRPGDERPFAALARAVGGRVELRARRAGAALRVEVRDDGVGLPPGFDAGACAGVGLRWPGCASSPRGRTASRWRRRRRVE